MSFLSQLLDPVFWISQPWFLLLAAFQIWMLVDAIRREEWIWAIFIFIGWGLTAFWYYFYVYRPSAGVSGFELPGTATRQRIRELQAQIYHLDKAHYHFQLGDIYFRKGKFAKAEKYYRAALEREPKDIDTRAHLGQVLLRLKRPQEAKTLLQNVCLENMKHEFGYSLMAYAESLMALGETDAAIETWQMVLANNSYARARVQLAELLIEKGKSDQARGELREVLEDDFHAPKFQRRRDRFWIKRARRLLGKLRK